jgi:hypothetical protein
VYGGRIALHDNALVLQANRIAIDEGLEFDPKQFNFATKLLGRFKVANNITRIGLHGEGADVDMGSVSITREQLPRILGKYNMSQIYNFDETGLLFHLLATVGNVCGITKDRKGGRRHKNRLTAG